MTAIIIFLILAALLITGMPVSIALGLTVFTFLFGFTNIPMDSIALKLFTGIEKFEIMAIPFFILAGSFLTHGGVARRMIRFATSLVGHWHGGMALASVLACALFAAISGSSPATVMAVGSIMVPAMVKMGYPREFAVPPVATAGGLGILIPPSIVMVMYSVATSGMIVTGPNGENVAAASIGEMFIAGVVPGLILAAMLGVTTYWRARRNNYPRLPRASFRERWSAFRESICAETVFLLKAAFFFYLGMQVHPSSFFSSIHSILPFITVIDPGTARCLFNLGLRWLGCHFRRHLGPFRRPGFQPGTTGQ